MIFGSVIRRAESAVGSIVDQALSRVLIAIPLLVASGFATASASVYLNARYGPELGNLMMAGGFFFIGLLAAAYVAIKSPSAPSATTATGNEGALTGDTPLSGQPATSLSSSEREVFNAVFASAAPIAVPGLVRILLRNIPLLVAILLAAFVLTRRGDEADVSPPAEAATS